MYHKPIQIGLLLHFKSFTSYFNKLSLINGLIYRSFEICSTGTRFVIKRVQTNLTKKSYPTSLIDKFIKKCLIIIFYQHQSKDISGIYYFKLPYIGKLPKHVKMTFSKLVKKFWKES